MAQLFFNCPSFNGSKNSQKTAKDRTFKHYFEMRRQNRVFNSSTEPFPCRMFLSERMAAVLFPGSAKLVFNLFAKLVHRFCSARCCSFSRDRRYCSFQVRATPSCINDKA